MYTLPYNKDERVSLRSAHSHNIVVIPVGTSAAEKGKFIANPPLFYFKLAILSDSLNKWYAI